MSDLLICGMEMPKSCSRCFCMASCRLWKNIMHPEFNRHRNCTLIPVPPHGRLIDADALIKNLEISAEGGNNGAALLRAAFIEVLKAAPTIIPAEEE